jgi:hypothetical protein
MAHAVGVETFVRQCWSHGVGSCTLFPDDVADAEPGEAGAMTIKEESIVGRRRATTFGQERAEDFGNLRPQWANAFLCVPCQTARWIKIAD